MQQITKKRQTMAQQTQTKQLPKGWKKIPLSEVLDYEQPNGYIVNSEILVEKTPIPVLTANKEFIKGYTKETDGIYRNIPVIIFDDFTADNKFVNFPFKVKSSAMKILKIKDKNAHLKYIFYQMQLRQADTGTHKRYYLSTYQNLHLLFPIHKDGTISLQEQQLIVSAIETQFSRLDEAVKVLKSVKDKLRVYRKAVLKKAFEKEGIKKEKIANICVPNPSKAEVKTLDENLEVSFIPMAYVSEEGKIVSMDKRPLKEVSKGFTFFKNGDVLLAKITPCFENGKKAIAEGLTNGIGFGTTEFYVFRPNEKASSKWIFYNISREDFRALAKRSMGGAVGQQRVSKTMIENFEVPVPSIEDQKKIVQEIESKFSVINKVEEVVNQSLIKAEKLRKSILKFAFEGKLVKTEEMQK